MDMHPKKTQKASRNFKTLGVTLGDQGEVGMAHKFPRANMILGLIFSDGKFKETLKTLIVPNCSVYDTARLLKSDVPDRKHQI